MSVVKNGHPVAYDLRRFSRFLPQALNEDQARDAMEEEAEYEEEDYGEEEEEEEEDYDDEAVGIIDGEAVVDYSAFCPADDDMTPQGLATLKRLEAALCNGVENSEVIFRMRFFSVTSEDE